MQNIQNFLELWSLTSPELLTTTPTSHVYKVKLDNKAHILKIYTELGRSCESDAPYFFQHCNTSKTVKVIKFDENAMLMEYINGPMLKSLVDINDEQATQIIGRTLKTIHKSEQNHFHPFETLERRFLALFSHAEKPNAHEIISRGALLAKNLITNQTEICLLHGDMHHENILQREDGTWAAIDPQPLIGDRAYDCANTLHNPDKMPHLTENKERLLKQAKLLAGILGIDPQRIIDYAFVHGCLSACWSNDDEKESFSNSLAIKTSEILEPYTSMNGK